MDELRLFTAVDVPDSVRENAVQLQERLKTDLDGVKWTRPEKMHITLKFLGDMEEQKLPSVKEILRQCAGEQTPFDLRVSGPGTFPRSGRPRVLWVGVHEEETSVLEDCHDYLDERYADLGVDRESRDFHPHLTLGRVRNGAPDNVREVLNEEQGTVLGRFTVTSLTLYRSELHPDGSRYTALIEPELTD